MLRCLPWKRSYSQRALSSARLVVRENFCLPNSKRKQNAPEVLKVCPRDCFVISTTRNATANPRYGFGPSSEVTSNKKQSLTYEKVSFRFKRSCGALVLAPGLLILIELNRTFSVFRLFRIHHYSNFCFDHKSGVRSPREKLRSRRPLLFVQTQP